MTLRTIARAAACFGVAISATGCGWGRLFRSPFETPEPAAATAPAIAPGSFHPTRIALREMRNSELKELIDDRLTFVDSGNRTWIAPAGTCTDGASVPRLALWVTDGRFDQRFLKAAVIHDAYCQSDNADRCPEQYQTRRWQDVHRMFYEACIAGGTSESKAKLMFAAVYLAGPRWNDPERDLSHVEEALLQEEFARCQQWIEMSNPTVDEIESWMADREANLRESGT